MFNSDLSGNELRRRDELAAAANSTALNRATYFRGGITRRRPDFSVCPARKMSLSPREYQREIKFVLVSRLRLLLLLLALLL